MAIALHEEGKILEVDLTGELTKADYEHFVPEVDRLVKEHGKLRMLVRMHDFHGWTAGAIWKDIEYAFDHFRDIDRLALVGDKAWEHGMALFCKPFTAASIRYFDSTREAGQAELWLRSDLPTAKA